MKIQILSDCHLDHYSPLPEFANLVCPGLQADLLVIAGDLGDPEHSSYVQFLDWAAARWAQVVLVAGNHEYYGRNLGQTIELIRKLAGAWDNVHFLHQDKLELNGLTILGTTLWSQIDPDLAHELANSLNDWNQIKSFNYYLQNRHHSQQVKWLEKRLGELILADKPTLIVTHHLPSYQLIHPHMAGSDLNCAFASHLDYMLSHPIKAWICGHTHYPMQATINKVPLVVNPVGYPDENTNWDKACVLELEL